MPRIDKIDQRIPIHTFDFKWYKSSASCDVKFDKFHEFKEMLIMFEKK